jgi:hypothetical protein
LKIKNLRIVSSISERCGKQLKDWFVITSRGGGAGGGTQNRKDRYE